MEKSRPLNKLEQRICDISYKKGLSHLSSCLTAVRLIDNIYKVKKDDEPFILDNGHAGLALYVVLEKWYFNDAEALFEKHGVHPSRDIKDRIWASTGSLGQGLPIAVGMALADRTKPVYALTSDGAMNEGSNWEALRIAGEQRLENLRVTVNANGYTAYGKSEPELLDFRMQNFFPSLVLQPNMFDQPDWLQGVNGHYVVMDEDKYKEISNG
jgi:transketolase